MKFVLAALNAKYVHSNLAVYDIEAYTRVNWHKKYGNDESLLLSIKEYTINHNLDLIMQSLYKENATLIAFSCYIWNISEVLTIAKELKKVSPSLLIWLGGPEVSYNSKELLLDNKFIDGIIVGEGEATFFDLVNKYTENDIELSDIPGITYRHLSGKVLCNKPRVLLSMDEIPFIYDDLDSFENKILYYETSRGCPFSCSYCLSSIDKSVRFRNLSLVKKELSFFLDNKVKQVKFIDRTFNCDRQRARQIWQYLCDNDNGITNFHFEISADLIEQEDLDIFKRMRPGLIQLEIGLQTTNTRSIQEIRRIMDIDKLKSNMLAINEMGNIHQHLDLIAGLPYEDYNSFVESFNAAYAMKPNQLQLGFLKVLKGSYMEEQVKEYGLIYRDEQPYEVLATKWISYEEILVLKNIEEMVEVYYNSDQFQHTVAYMEGFFDTPFELYKDLADFYEKKTVQGIGYKREARYELLREFFKEHVGDDLLIFDSLLIFDYYLRENAKNRPSWSGCEPIDKNVYNDFFKNGGNDELSLVKEGYDSKVASRCMHIEPIAGKASFWIDGNNRESTCYVVFDYEKRNPLSRDAGYTIISHL